MEVKCRACLSTTGTIKYYPLSTVFPVYFKTNLTILELLEVVTSTSVCNFAGAPNRICQTCLKQLKNCYQFIAEFKKAQLWLKRKCNQPSATFSGKVEEHENDSDLGGKIIIKVDKEKKSLNFVSIKEEPREESSVENDKQDLLKVSESLLCTNQSDNDEETSVNQIIHDDENFVYVEHNYPKKIETSEDPNSSLVRPETIIVKVDPIEIIPNEHIKEPIRKIKPKVKKNDYQKLNPRVTYKFKEPPAVVCEICKNKFYTERALCVHQEIVHRDIQIIRVQPDIVTLKDEINKDQFLLQPSMERKTLSAEKNNKQTLVSEKCKSATREGTRVKKVAETKQRIAISRAVKKQVQTFTCDICQKVFKSALNFNRHKKVHEPKSYMCSECGLQCRTQSEYRNHTVKHKGKQFGCDECTKVYYTTTQLKDHKRLVHGVGLTHRYLCTQCGKRFKHLNGYKYHLAKVHHGEKPYMCKFCGYRSFLKSYIMHHERAHSGDKPYECKLCDKKFKNACTLKEHQFRHKGTAKFNCEYCGKGFIKSWNMKLHWFKHEGKYRCKMCSKSFVDETVLKFHYSHSHKVKDDEKIDPLSNPDSELLFVNELPDNVDSYFD